MVSCQSTFSHRFEIWIGNDPPEHTSVKSVVLHLRWAEPNGISFFTEPMTREDDGFLRITLVPVPDESQLGVLGHAVVSADVAVEESTFHPQRLSGQHAVRFQVHRPVYTSIDCGREKSHRWRSQNWWTVYNELQTASKIGMDFKWLLSQPSHQDVISRLMFPKAVVL